jgi:hypothetical protein
MWGGRGGSYGILNMGLAVRASAAMFIKENISYT